jgi:glutaredoxin-related protein
MKKIRVAIIESERGWGRKIDDVKEFDTMEEAETFIKEYNSYNTSPTAPDWYMQAELIG